MSDIKGTTPTSDEEEGEGRVEARMFGDGSKDIAHGIEEFVEGAVTAVTELIKDLIDPDEDEETK
jgi:hypothetical protein